MRSLGIFHFFSYKLFRAELSSSSESVGSLFFTARDSIIAPTKPLNKTIACCLLASLVTAINVLVASGFSIAAIIRPQFLVPAESVPTQASLLLAMYAAAPRIPLDLFALGAIYKQATPALLILGALAGAMQLLDAGIGLFEHDLGKCAGPLFIAVLQFFVVYLLHRSVRITPQTKRG